MPHEEDSPGLRLLRAVDTHLPCSITPLKLSIAAICLVEDLSLLFPQISIELGRATVGSNEVFVPIICDLQIFNSKDIGRFDDNCTNIPTSAILKGSVNGEEWYRLLVEEIAEALEDYVFALPLTVGNVTTSRGAGVQVRSNFYFEIHPGEKQKVFTNFRMPRYKTTVTAHSSYTLKKSVFSSGVSECGDLEEIGSHFPQGGLARPGKNKLSCSNEKISKWVNECLPERFVDHCFEGLFSPPGGVNDRLKLTILNTTNETIVVNEGEVIATLGVEI